MDNKKTPLDYMLKNFKKDYSGDYGIKLTPQKLLTFCEIDGPSFDVDWPVEGALDREVIAKISQVISNQSGHPD